MRSISSVIFIIIISLGVLHAQTNLSGTISTDQTWNAAGSPYIVTGNVTISSGVTVTVEAGAVIKFNSNTGLYVYGTLNATDADFTSNQPAPAKGDWNFIQIGNSGNTGSSSFIRCKIAYGGMSYTTNRGMLYLNRGTATVDDCDISFSNNYGAQVGTNGSLDLNDTRIFSSSWPIAYEGPGNLVINGLNDLSGNDRNGIYIQFTSNSNLFVLDTANVPFVFYSTFTVNSAGTLEVAEGNILKFASGARLWVDGILKAVGTNADPIYFTAYTDDNLGGDTNGDGTATVPGSRYWDGIYFRDSSNDGECVIQYSFIRYAGSGNIGAVNAENASPKIDHCDISNSYFGAMIKNVSNPIFTNNTIGSSELVPIAMSMDANPVFSNNTFSFSDNQYDAIGLLSGALQASSVLPKRSVTGIPNITYLLLGDITVPEGMTLTIHKGIVIKGYQYNQHLLVKGKLIAQGGSHPDSMITFTSAKDDNHGNPKDTNRDGTQSTPQIADFGGIVFENTSDPASIVSYCRLKYARPYIYRGGRWIEGGAVTTDNASPTISFCEINNVRFGVYAFQSSNPTISNNTFSNAQYTPIALSVSADPSFTGNTFVNNAWTALGLIGGTVGSNGTIKLRSIAGYDSITYVLLENMTINSGTDVQVAPGVVIKMNLNTLIDVQGGFKADGNPGAGQIVFTSLRDDNYGNPGDTNGDGSASSPSAGNWRTIAYKATANDPYNALDNCLFKFGGQSQSEGVISYTDAAGSVTNSEISDSYYYGLYCNGASAPTFNGVKLKNCRVDPIAMSLTSNPTFLNIIFEGNGSNGIRIIEGTLSSDATLAQRNLAGIENIAYIIDQLTISSNAVLTLDPGVVIKFPVYYSGITVNGALVANGTSEQNIVLTSLKDDSNGGDTNNDGNGSTPARGDWFSVRFGSSANANLNSMKNCILRYGGSAYYSENYKQYGMLRIFDTFVDVNGVTIEQSNSAGIGIYGSANPSIQNSEIINIRYTPVTMSMFANPSFQNNFIANLGIIALGIVPEVYSSTATIPIRNFGGFNNITYYLHQTPTINSGTTITIPAGVVFKYNSYNGFDVNGAIRTEGTAGNPVVFTHEYDDGYGNPKDTNEDGSGSSPTIGSSYYSIYFGDVSDDANSLVNHTIMRFRNAGVYLQQAAPTITNCIFDQNNWGVVLNGVSTPVVQNNTFHNLTYSPLVLSLVSYPSSVGGNVISGNTYRAIGILQEELVQDVTLPKRDFAGIVNIPYYFSGNYVIGTSVTLTLDPGLVLKFPQSRYLQVKKGLIAEGGASADSQIVFTDIRDDFYGGDTNADSNLTKPVYTSGWDGIIFEDASLDPLCRLKNCVIQYAGRSSNRGAIVTNSASPGISFSVLKNNRQGLVANAASNPTVNNCDIYQNATYGINNVNRSFTINAENNWWGSNTGPTHSSNPGGTGQTVTDAVDFTPFLFSGALNPLMGDVSLNGLIQAYDGSLVLQEVVSPGGLNDRQLRVADVTGNNAVTAMDASLILQYIVELIPAFDSEMQKQSVPQDLYAQIKSKIADLTPSDVILSGTEISAGHGDNFDVTLNLSNVNNVRALQAGLSFDKDLLEVVSVIAGAAVKDMELVYNADSETGILRLAVAGTQVLSSDGEMAIVTFRTRKKVKGDHTTLLKVDAFMANEKDLTDLAKAIPIKITGAPTTYALAQNYPNPFNSTTRIRYQIADDNASVILEIFDITGRLITTLVNAVQEAGIYEVAWDGTNANGASVSSGIYFYRLRTKNFIGMKKFHLLK